MEGFKHESSGVNEEKNGDNEEHDDLIHTSEADNKSSKDISNLKWSSRLEFFVSLLGYSLGLGDIWRLPYLVFRNGGGAFLIPYTICMLTCGIPLYFLEICISQFSGKGPWNVWDISPLFQGLGITFAVLNWLCVCYGVIIRSWILDFIVNSFSAELPWASCENPWNTDACYSASNANSTSGLVNSTFFSKNTSMFFNETRYHDMENEISNVTRVSAAEEFWENKVLRRSSGIDDFGQINGIHVVFIIVTHVLVFLSLTKSVQSIGKLMYITAIGPIVLVIIIWIRALTLPGSIDGMYFFIYPEFERLQNVNVWIEAAFMTFFTLGPGWGGLIMMGSHNKFSENCLRCVIGPSVLLFALDTYNKCCYISTNCDEDNVIASMLFVGFGFGVPVSHQPNDAVATTLSLIAFGILNGLVVFSVIGVMAKELDVPVSKTVSSGGFSLAFVAYPQAVNYFPIPQLWSLLFFIMLFLPGVDAEVVMTEPVLAVIEEAFPKLFRRRRIALLTFVTCISCLLSLPLTTQAGVYILQLLDWYVPTWSPLLAGTIEAIIFSWIYGCDRISRDLTIMLGRPLPHFIRICAAFFMPIILPILLCVSFYQYKPPKYGSYVYPDVARLVGWCMCLLTFVPALLYSVFLIIKAKGSFAKRISSLTSPAASWEPADEGVKRQYKLSEKRRSSNFRSIFLFNVTGKHGSESVKCDEEF